MPTPRNPHERMALWDAKDNGSIYKRNEDIVTNTPKQPLWTLAQLALEAEVIVVGRYGREATYKILKKIRDDYEVARQQDAQRIAQLENELRVVNGR